jgi:predicted Zn-dependent protease with MMP-like domain
MRVPRPARRPTRPGPRRDRRGRGLRGVLAPRAVPLSRTRSEAFDDLVLDAVDDLEAHWAAELAGVEFAVEDVPQPSAAGSEFDPEVVSDRGVPLGRLHRAGLGHLEGPVIVVYRRPVEARAVDEDDRGELVFMVVAELVAELLGRNVDEIDPPRD